VHPSAKPEMVELFLQAGHRGVETSIDELCELVDFSGAPSVGALDRLSALSSLISSYKFELIPPITSGSFDSRRILRTSAPSNNFFVDREVTTGETHDREFKASLLFDFKRAAELTSEESKECKNEDLTNACLKTIAAFLNGDGGTLLVGITDQGSVCGIESDFQFMKTSSSDAWELYLRDKIKSCFKDGSVINDYVHIDFGSSGDSIVARVRVTRRRDVCYCKGKDGFFWVWRRQGNRTVKTDITEMEEFVRTRDRLSRV
jgi:hypothetical protein